MHNYNVYKKNYKSRYFKVNAVKFLSKILNLPLVVFFKIKFDKIFPVKN